MCKGKSCHRRRDFSKMYVTMTGVVYLVKLVEFIVLILEEMGFGAMLLPHDGAPLHFHKEVMGCFCGAFSEEWTGRARPDTWPALPPDCTPNSCLWGYISDPDCVFSLAPTLSEISGKVRAELATVNLDLFSVWTEKEYSYVYWATQGVPLNICQM